MRLSHDETEGGFGYWGIRILAAVFLIFGLPIFAGGIWLVALGGSWYYVFAGFGLLLTGYFLLHENAKALSAYLLTFIGTVAWALWEAGLNGWAQVPRLVAPTVMLVLLALAAPRLLRRGDRIARRGRTAAAFSIVLLAALGVALYQVAPRAPEAFAQAEPSSSPAPADPAPPETVDQQPAAAPADQPGGAAEPAAPVDTVPSAPAEQDAAPAEPAEPDAAVPATPGSAPGAGGEPASAPQAAEADGEVTYPMFETGADWPAFGGTHHATRYSPLTQITKENVAGLQRVWEYRTGALPEGDEAFSNQNTPLKIGDRLFMCAAMNRMFALDAATGEEIWSYDPQVSREAIPYNATCRGVAYYETPNAPADQACARRVIGGTLDARLIAVDAETGEPCADFGEGGQVDLNEGIGNTAPGFYSVTSPVTIVRNIAVVGAQVLDGQRREAPSGVVRGYNTETGELEWAWDMGRPGETGAPQGEEVYTPGTPNMWTIATGDNELGYVYLPMGNAAVDYWGGDRSDVENEYSTSIVAIDVTTGEPVWHYQTVHYDVWDYDLGSQGTLIDFPTENGPVPALILPTKQAQFFIFDRRNGELLVDVEEREAPQGGVEPERLSPTQPYVADFPSLLKPELEERNMWGMTPLDQLWCRIQYRQSSYQGRYTPPTVDQHWIQYPGYNGGSDWGGIAVDEGRGILVANYNDTPNHNRLLHRERVEELGVVPIDEPGGSGVHSHDSVSPQAGTPYGIDVNAGWRVPLTGLLCKEPPYGGITAIDLNTREVLWDRPFGTARRNGPFGIPSMLPIDIGTPNNGGAVVTAGGLIFIAAATDDLIRAIDIETGEVLWQDVLPAGGQATPAVYEVGGRQFLVMMAGGHNFMETPIGDYVWAYALP